MDIYFYKEETDRFLRGEIINREYAHFAESDCEDLEIFLANILRSVSMEFLLEIIFTVLNELLVNAFKANAKRIFFERIGKDINDFEDYNSNLGEFRNEFGEFRDTMKQSLLDSHYRIQLNIRNSPTALEFWVTNNSKILNQEQERILSRIESSKKIKNLTEAYQENLDTMESSGLGIVLVKLLLKNSGIIENKFQVSSNENETVAYFEIPKSILPENIKEQIQSIIQDSIDSIPTFPKIVVDLLKMIEDQKVGVNQVAKRIERDPALVVEVLKLANSPLYRTRSSIININEAIQNIGLGNLQEILYALGTKQLFPGDKEKIRSIWDHAIRTAFYATRLLDRRTDTIINRSIVSMGGLVHDLGRMALVSLESSVIDVLNGLRVDKLLNQSEFIEEISLGSSHTEIGFILAKKWNFPEELQECILYHHRPWLANHKYRAELETIYIADFLANRKKRSMNYVILNPDIIKKYEFQNIFDLLKFEDQVSSEYDNYLESN